MMKIYKISYEKIRQKPEMIAALLRAFNGFDMPFYLIGAVARDVWMRAINDMPPRRATTDIDFAIRTENKGAYEAMRDYLIEKEGFSPYKGNSFVLIWKDGTEVDLLPFGLVEDEERNVKMGDIGLAKISMQGFMEVYAEGLPSLELEDGHTFSFCTLPGIVLLKFIAWDDRPEARKSDIEDICDILEHSFDMNEEAIYKHHLDLWDDFIDQTHTAARVIGRDMKKIALQDKKLFERLEKILNVATIDISGSNLSVIMAKWFKKPVEYCVGLLIQLKKGFTE